MKSFHTYTEMTDNGSKRKRDLYRLRMAKKVCEDWASVLLNEKTEIVVDDTASSEYLQGADGSGGVFDVIDFWEEANALVEKAFYSGTGAFVLKLDGVNAEEDGSVGASPEAAVRMEFLAAGQIIPISRRGNDITEAAFISMKTVRGKEQLYLETHTLENGAYVIENRFYSVDNGTLAPVPAPDGVAARFATGSPVPFFAIIRPNTVNPYKNNLGLGCAVFSQAIDCLKGVDLAYNNFCRDFKLGGKKVFYNRNLTKTAGVAADSTPIFITPDDMMQQLFVSVGDENVSDDKTLIQEFNPDLRVQANRDGVQAQLDYLTAMCGFGARHYRFDGMGSGIVTATQYTGERQDLKQHAAKHGIAVNKALRGIVRALLWSGRNILGQPVNPDADIKVEFSDGYIVSDEEKRASDREDLRDGVLQAFEYRMRWYGEDEATAKAMTQGKEPMFGEREFSGGEG